MITLRDYSVSHPTFQRIPFAAVAVDVVVVVVVVAWVVVEPVV